jgi:hypothetical protein
MNHSDQKSLDFHDFDVENWFANRLAEHGKKIFLGSTTFELRRQRIREAILERGVDYAIIGTKADGKPETYAQAFERFYSEPLHAKGK